MPSITIIIPKPIFKEMGFSYGILSIYLFTTLNLSNEREGLSPPA